MKIFHTSPEKIEKVYESDFFGDCLFFALKPYFMNTPKYIYSIELDESKIVRVRDLYDEKIISEIQQSTKELLDIEIDEDDAERLLDGRLDAYDLFTDYENFESGYELGKAAGELGWIIQGLQGKCGKKMGFEAVEAQDEQGTVYIVPMMGRENDLVLEEVVGD